MYASVTDATNFLPKFTATSQTTPTLAQITAWLGYCDGEINSAIKARGLVTPVTAPVEFVMELQQLEGMGAAAWIAQLAFPETQAPDGTPLGKQLWGAYQARLVELRAGIGVPVGVQIYEQDLAARAWLTDSQAWGVPNGTVTDAFGDPVNGEPAFSMAKRW